MLETILLVVAAAVAVMLLLWRYAPSTREPRRPRWGVGAAVVTAGAVLYNSGLLPKATVCLLAVGTFTILSNRSRFWQVVGLCIVEAGVHLALPHLPLVAEAGILAALVLAVWLLLETGKEKEVGA
ncbi:MAG TPA: hypothetical protein VNT75_04710 [Symbiobacteriaceae bacterium]|nr:hypothetical protein [Symbiobacteriaceae bacterium]